MSPLSESPTLELLPAVDVADGKAVRLVQGEAGSETSYGDPLDAADHGLKYGLAVAYGPIKSRTIAAFAHDKREFTDDEIEVISATIRRLHDITEPPESLTKAQQEALRCIAEGDRHAAAAAKLGITESAFKARLISARERLMARTTAEALQRAKDYRLL